MKKEVQESRIESEAEIKLYIQKLNYALDNGARLTFQERRLVDENREERYTNKYTVAELFPDEDPVVALKRELRKLTVEEYIKTAKDLRFPNRRKNNGDENHS